MGAMKRAVPVAVIHSASTIWKARLRPAQEWWADPLRLLDTHLPCTLAVGIAAAGRLHSIRQTTNPYCAMSTISLWVVTAAAQLSIPSNCFHAAHWVENVDSRAEWGSCCADGHPRGPSGLPRSFAT